MNRCLALAHRALSCLAVVLVALAAALPARAGPVVLEHFFEGQGSLVYDPASGIGAWLGTMDSAPFPMTVVPLSLLSQVSFSFDTATGRLGGSFELTDNADFNTTLEGVIDAEFVQGDFAGGGQLVVNYLIQSGSGRYDGVTGFGLSLFDFGPFTNNFADYVEAGVITAVPEPGSLALAAAALLMLAQVRRRARQGVPR